MKGGSDSHSSSVQRSRSEGTGIFAGRTVGGSAGGIVKGNEQQDANTWNEYDADSDGTSRMSVESEGESEGESHTKNWSESRVPMLIPKMGKELIHRTPDPIADQDFRAMAALHDQKQRQCVVRIVEQNIPVSIHTPTVNPVPYNKRRIESYLHKQLNHWPFVLESEKVEKQIQDREKIFTGEFLAAAEPVPTKRKIK
jgi:hypothetical protein